MVLVKQIFQRELNNNPTSKFKSFNISTKEYVEAMQHSLTLIGHEGCVNTICWNKCGSMLVSGSDDKNIILWGECGHRIQKIKTLHKDNIFSVVFVPESDDSLLLSASGDSSIFLHDLNHLGDSHVQDWSNCKERVKRLVVTESEPRLFWSACEDGFVREHDIRSKKTEKIVDLKAQSYHVKSLAINNNFPEMIAVAVNDSMVPIFDRRYTKTSLLRLLPGHLSLYEPQKRRLLRSALVTHLSFNQKGNEILVNISSDNIYVFNIRENSTESSPNVLNALNNFLYSSSEKEQINLLRKNRHKEANLFYPVRKLVKIFENANKFSQAIDLCSKTIATYCRENRITSVFFHRSSSARTMTKNCSLGFAQILLQRGICYMKRNWEGDSMCALRDFLQCLEIDPQKNEAIYWVVSSLLNMKQNVLAKKFYELYNLQLRNHEEKFEKLVEKYENVPFLDAWSSQRYNQFNDYIERYCGATNFNTDIKEANWFGGQEEMIVAGSDCGNLYIWERKTQKILRLFHADEYSVNCVQSHPDRLLLATSGIEPVIRLWEPTFIDNNDLPKKKKNSTTLEDITDVQKRDLTSEIYDVTLNNHDHGLENFFFDTAPLYNNFFFRHLFDREEDDEHEYPHPQNNGSSILCRTM